MPVLKRDKPVLIIENNNINKVYNIIILIKFIIKLNS